MKLKRFKQFLNESTKMVVDLPMIVENTRKPDVDQVWSPELKTVLTNNAMNQTNSLCDIFLHIGGAGHKDIKDVVPIPEQTNLTQVIWSDQNNNGIEGDIMQVVEIVCKDSHYLKNDTLKKDFLKKYKENIEEIYSEELDLVLENENHDFENNTEWFVEYVLLDNEKEIVPSSLEPKDLTAVAGIASGIQHKGFSINRTEKDGLIITQFEDNNVRLLEEYLQKIEDKFRTSKTVFNTENEPKIKFDFDSIREI